MLKNPEISRINMKISIIIPAYNEEKRIASTLETYSKHFENLKKSKKINYELLIVINNTIDNTEKIVKKFQKKNKNIRYLNFKQGGKGFAIIEGFKDALKREDNDLIGFVDADMSTSPEEFAKLFDNIKYYHGIIASRYIKGAIVPSKQPIKRIIVSRIGNFIIRSLFLMPYRDTQCGAKIFRREAIRVILPKLGLTQWAFDIDLLYRIRKAGFRVKEHPTFWNDKEASKLNVKKASIQVFLAIIQLRINNSPFKPMLKILKPMVKYLWKKTQ